MSNTTELERLLREGGISRREFLARSAAMAAVGAAPAIFSQSAQAATPKKGGRLRMGITDASTTDSLDPGASTTMMQAAVQSGQIGNNLVEIDADGVPQPELAESYESTPDAAKWVFNLRKGVEFHNGKSLEAEDVVDSINHHRGEDSTSGAKGVMGGISDVKADGKHTVIFELSGGSADFPFIVSDFHLHIFPAGTRGVEEFNKGIATGPYVVQEWEPGVRSFATRNPNYWKEGRAHFDEVETLAILDANARTNALQTGAIDMMNRCEQKTVHMLKSAPGIEVVQTDGTQHYSMPMHTQLAPFDNNDVRLALKHGVDREALLKTILRGIGYLGNDFPIGKANRYRATEDEIPQRQYDPDQAKFHLKKAGMDSMDITLQAADAAFPGAVDTGVLFAEHASKAGINVTVDRVPDDGYWSDIWLQSPFCFCFWFGRPTEDMMFSTTYAAEAAWNDAHWQHERFNKLLVEARAMLDVVKRREIYVEMQRIVRDDGGTIIPLFASDLMAATDKLKHGKVAANIQMDGLRIAERWWFDS